MKKNKKGFTLVELVIVIAVIAILSVVLIPTLTGVIGDAKQAKAKSACNSAVTNYVTENTGATPADGTLFVSGGYYFVYDSTSAEDQLTLVQTAPTLTTVNAGEGVPTGATHKTATAYYKTITLTNAVNGVTIYLFMQTIPSV